MDKKIDMTYSFLWDSEPTDEQLIFIMKEVAEEAKQSNELISKQILENIKKESVMLHAKEDAAQCQKK